MTFPGFYTLGAAWLFLLLVPLVVFYFLKLKRPRLEVPSLALWRAVLNDQRVNAPFQKFKRNLLLLLQMLLLSLLALAAMQPFVRGGNEQAQFLPVLIDCSASMAAVDKPGGTTRLEIAKQRVRNLIDDLPPGRKLSLIAFHTSARRLTDFTDNKRELNQAIDSLKVAEVPSRIEEALRMTQALARTVPIQTVLLLTDGNVPSRVEFDLPFEVQYQLLPPGGPNLGITTLNARRSAQERWDLFVRVEGSAADELSGRVIVFQDGNRVADESVVLEKGESQRLVFSVESPKASSLEVRLEPDGPDSLTADNIAFLDLPASRPLRVYADPHLAAFRHALRSLKGIALSPDDSGDGSAAEYDLAIHEKPAAESGEATVSLFVGLVPADLKQLVTVKDGSAAVVDWQRGAPLLQHVLLSEVETSDEPTSAEGVRDGDFEQAGYEILAYGRSGPLLLKKRHEASVHYYLLFHTDHSTFPYRIGFPILVRNLVQIALQQAALSEVRAVQTGILPTRTLTAETAYHVTGPAGFASDATSNTTGRVSGVPAPRVGRYLFAENGNETTRIGAALLDSRETSLAAAETIQFRELSVTADEKSANRDRPLWPLIALIGFCVLLVEWWYFNRRPGGLSA